MSVELSPGSPGEQISPERLRLYYLGMLALDGPEQAILEANQAASRPTLPERMHIMELYGYDPSFPQPEPQTGSEPLSDIGYTKQPRRLPLSEQMLYVVM